MGIVVVSWKLDCLAALNNSGDRKLLRSLLLELFSEPALALQFLAETFGVEEHGMNLGGRLAAYKHVSGKPASFPSDALRAVANPEKLIGEWMSRNLCALDELPLSAAGAHERGLSTAEIAALGARLRSPALVREAHKVGCVVHFDGDESNKTLGPSKLLFNWNFALDDDAGLTALLCSLRPVLLKCPPNSLTRARRLTGALAPGAAAVGAIGPRQAGVGSLPAVVADVPGAGQTGYHLAKPTGGVKRKAMGDATGQTNLPGASRNAKPRRAAAVKSARCVSPTAATCACSSERSVDGSKSWLVAEVRKTGSAAVLGIAVGFQLPWSLDAVEGGRVAIKYLLSEVAVPSGGLSKRQYSLRVTQGEDRVLAPNHGVPVVTQATTVSGNYKSRDFAAAVQDLCEKLVPDAGAPLLSPVADGRPPTAPVPAVTGPSAVRAAGTGAVGGLPSDLAAGMDAAVDTPVATPPSQTPVSTPNVDPPPHVFNIIDAPAAAVLSLNVTVHSPVALNTELHSAFRSPGRLVLFFPVSDHSSNPMGVC